MTNVKKSLKKLGALALCLCLALALLPTAAFADSTTATIQLWKQVGEGTVTVEGTPMVEGDEKEFTTETGKLTVVCTPASGYYYCLLGCANVSGVVSDTVISGSARTVEIDVSGVDWTEVAKVQLGVAFYKYVSVTGTVKDADGNAASGATIVFTDTSNNTYKYTTDTNGSYTASLPQCDCDYVVTSSDGLQKATGTVTVESTTEELDEITMEVVAYKVRAEVLTNGDGSGTVSVNGTSDKSKVETTVSAGETASIVITPDSGSYILGYILSGEESAIVYSKDTITKTVTVNSTKILKVRFDKYVKVSGTVKEKSANDGGATPALPATITFTITDSTGKYSFTDTVTTGEDGSYSIDLPQGTCTYEVTSDNGLQYASDTTGFTLSEDYTLDITMTNTTTGDEVVSARSTANTKIDEAATAAKAAIDDMDNLSDDEKTAQKAAVDEAVKAAKENIAAATTPAAVTEAQKAGETAIDEVQTAASDLNDLNKAKKDAESAIDTAASEAKAKLAGMNLTEDEKTALETKIDEAAAAAKETVSSATVDNESPITEAQSTLETALAEIQTEAEADDFANDQSDAKAAIDEEAQAAKDAVDALTSLSDEEKAAYKKTIDEKAAAAKEAVDAADDQAGIDAATEALDGELKTVKKESEEQNIKNKELQDAKDTANEQIDTDAQAAKDAIDAMENLTDDEKTALKAKVDEAAQAAKDAVDAAETTDAVADAKTALTESLAEIEDEAEAQDLADAKANALAQIEADAQAAKDAIDALDNLTDAEKQAAKDAIDEAAQAAKDAVNAAETTEGVENALNALDTSLESTQDESEAQDKENAEAAAAEKALEDAKAAAEKQIESDVQAAEDAIDEKANLTDDEKSGLKAEVGAAEQTAKDAVEKAASTDDVQAALDTLAKSLASTQDEAEQQDEAAAVEQSAEDFIAKYLTDKDGNVYKEATSSNYSDILSGLAAWNALTQAEKDAINAKLAANGGVSYEQLLTGAQTAKKNAEAGKSGDSGKGTTAPRTSDDTPIALYAVLAIVCAAGLGITAVATKKRKAQR